MARSSVTVAVAACVAVVCVACTAAATTTPVVLYHGMGDSCCNPRSIGTIVKLIQSALPDAYVHSIEIGTSDSEDVRRSFFDNMNTQIEQVCAQLRADSRLSGGFNAIGFSQGGQFLRAYVERCNAPPVRRLITLGGQHQGVFGFPRCPANSSELCEMARKLLQETPYDRWIQDRLVQAQYWHDPLQESEYASRNIFLPDINNEGGARNTTYRDNMLTLELFSMTMFEQDSFVQPRSSSHFGYYASGSDSVEVPLQQTQLYTDDWLGLRKLDEFTSAWFTENIVPLLNTTTSA